MVQIILICCRIDGKGDGGFGPLMNDNHLTPNLKVKIVNVDGDQYPVFFARRDINIGEELTYCYGPTRKEYWWRYKG